MGKLSHLSATAITNAQLDIVIYLAIHMVYIIAESKNLSAGRDSNTEISHHYFTEIRSAENYQVWNSESVHLLDSLNGSLIWDYIYIE